DVGAGLGELVAVGAGAGGRGPASPLWGGPGGIGGALTPAGAGRGGPPHGLYFYREARTSPAPMLLPPAVPGGGPDQTLAALTDAGRRAALLDGEKLTGTYLRNVYLGTVPGDRAGVAGLSVAEAAARDGRPAGEWVLDLLVAADLNVGGHLDRL